MAATPSLQRKLQQTLGAEAAADLGAWMQNMDAHRGDVSELRRDVTDLQREMRAGFAKIDERFAKMDERFAKMDERFASVDGRMDAMSARFEAMMEKGLREQMRFFFLAWSVQLAALIGLYAR